MKVSSKIKNKLGKMYHLLRRPDTWFQNLKNDKSKRKRLILTLILFLSAGAVLQKYWPFPYFWGFVTCFILIGCLTGWAISYFSSMMNLIVTTISSQPPAQLANHFYFRYCTESNIYIIAPLLITSIFGVGGCMMFGAIMLTPTLIWILILFFFIVYASIIGYLQYMVLAIYIRNLACGHGQYKRLQKNMVECIPAQLDWIQKLTKLSHTYQNCFFTLGSLFILAYSAFCWLPHMQADKSSLAFYILWGIIFIMIVLLFPVVSFLEYGWIKVIVGQLKESYIRDLTEEKRLREKQSSTDDLPYKRLIQTICATQILNSRDYPIPSVWTKGYSAVLSAFNLIATIMTVFQGLPMLSNAFRQIF